MWILITLINQISCHNSDWNLISVSNCSCRLWTPVRLPRKTVLSTYFLLFTIIRVHCGMWDKVILLPLPWVAEFCVTFINLILESLGLMAPGLKTTSGSTPLLKVVMLWTVCTLELEKKKRPKSTCEFICSQCKYSV